MFDVDGVSEKNDENKKRVFQKYKENSKPAVDIWSKEFIHDPSPL